LIIKKMIELSVDRAISDNFDEAVIRSLAEQSLLPEYLFRTAHNLITVDAPDGSGKGIIASLIRQQLSSVYGCNNVLLVSPNRFYQSPQALEIGKKLKNQPNLSPSSVRHNSHFMATAMVNYRTVISPALEAGKIVVIDSSEIRSLAYMLDRGSSDAVRSTLRWIRSGRTTSGILAGNRILVTVSPDDCLANINARGKRDYGDPIDYDEALKRANCYSLSVLYLRGLKQDYPSHWIYIENPRIEVDDVSVYLNQLVSRKIIPFLSF